jgi:hypothetical protein
MKPSFILGVGCQKGGTTWLYSYLESHPEVSMSPTKEMHIFDALFMPEMFGAFYKQSLLRVHREITSIIRDDRLMPAANIGLQDELDRLNIYHDPREYPRYFLRLAGISVDKRPLVKAVGEISPTYAALNADHFHQIRNQLKTDFNIKVVFLMREPIERIWSQQRMIEGKPAKSRDAMAVVPGKLSPEFFKHPEVVARTAYNQTIEALERVFERQELFYGFYETLFSETEMKRLCEFLGITYVKADFGKRIGASSISGEPPDIEAVKEARRYYDKTYSFCAERFTEDLIGRIWKNYHLRG